MPDWHTDTHTHTQLIWAEPSLERFGEYNRNISPRLKRNMRSCIHLSNQMSTISKLSKEQQQWNAILPSTSFMMMPLNIWNVSCKLTWILIIKSMRMAVYVASVIRKYIFLILDFEYLCQVSTCSIPQVFFWPKVISDGASL